MISKEENKRYFQVFKDTIDQNMIKYINKTVVIINGKEYQYEELNDEADRIASYLSRNLYDRFPLGMNTDNPICIGVCLPHGFRLLASILAICRLGYTYVPLDPMTPNGRLMFIFNDCKMTAVLIEQDEWNNDWDGMIINLSKIDGIKLSQPIYVNPNPCVAYIIYTSGTTGNPKGVPISYSNLVHMLHNIAAPNVFNITQHSKVLGFASIAFDASIIELYGTLFYGATLIMVSESERFDAHKIYHIIQKNEVSFMQLTPSLAVVMPDLNFPSLDTFVLIGEKMIPSVIDRAIKYSYRLMNGYGPTENTVVSTIRLIKKDTEIQNIGKTLPGVEGYVLNPDLTQVKPGEIGELCLGGLQLTSGYLNRPDLNERVFIKNFFHKENTCQTLYRTGDLVRLEADGSYEFIGRMDFQIKLNGHRIELGEVITQIEKCDNVVQAYVTVESSKLGDRLVAYVKIKGDEINKDTYQAIKHRLKKFLPYYMIPSVWISVDEFPHTLNGKIDIKKLTDLYSLSNQPSVSTVSLTEKEEILLGVISHLLNQEIVDIDADLLDDLGMTSMQIMQLPMEVEIFGLYISVDDIYRYRTIRKIVQNHSMSLSYWFNEPLPGKPVLVIISGYTSFAFLYSAFAKALSDKYSIYVFESYHDYPEELRSSTSELVDYYLEVLLPIVRQYGVDVITGFCLGGELGLLLAHELYNKASILPHVVVLDGEVGRSKSEDEVVPLYFDFFSDEINAKRNKLDMRLIETIPDFRYEGEVTSILSKHFMSDISPFSKRLVVTEMHKKYAKIFFDRAAEYWQMYYPDCHIMYVNADHWSFLRFPESLKPICTYFSNLGE